MATTYYLICSNFSAPCVNLASESDEEVLVDDFDGQCCRTYPENHSRIIKWRSQRAEKLRLQQASHPPTSAQQKQDSQPPLPPPSSSSSRTTCSSSTTTSAVVKPMSSSLVPRKSQDGGKSSSVPTTSGMNIFERKVIFYCPHGEMISKIRSQKNCKLIKVIIIKSLLRTLKSLLARTIAL